MAPLEIPDPASGGRVAEAGTTDASPAVPATTGPAGRGSSGGAESPDPAGRAAEPQIRRQTERALGGSMLKSMLAASLAANGGIRENAPDSRLASTLSVADDAVHRAAPSLAAMGRQEPSATMQSLLDSARAVMAARPDLAPPSPGNGSGGDTPVIDLRDWDTRKADEARESYVIASLRVLTDAMFCLAGGDSLEPAALLRELSTNLAVHLDRLPPAIVPEAGDSAGAGFPEFVDTLRTLAVQLRG